MIDFCNSPDDSKKQAAEIRFTEKEIPLSLRGDFWSQTPNAITGICVVLDGIDIQAQIRFSELMKFRSVQTRNDVLRLFAEMENKN